MSIFTAHNETSSEGKAEYEETTVEGRFTGPAAPYGAYRYTRIKKHPIYVKLQVENIDAIE